METLRILVVDDEAGMRLAVTRALREARVTLPELDMEVAFAVDAAESGEEALERVAHAPPDLLLLDHKMPGLSGLEVLDELAKRHLDLLVIMITAYATIETAVTATQRGAFDFLAKPFTPEELRGVLAKAASRLLLARQARRLAHEKRQVRFEFVRVLGHELQAPLAAVESSLDVLRTRALGSELSAYDGVLGRCTARLGGMQRMIRDLLDLTRIESGRLERRLADVDLAEAALAALDTVAAAAAARGITLELHAGTPVVLAADRGEIDMILHNLLSNAVKYNRDGGRVDVTIAHAGNRAAIEVADTGAGLTREQSARLFQEFVRIRTPENAHVDGSGLGLSIVRRLAALYGGTVRVNSEPGCGATFTVELECGLPAATAFTAVAEGAR
ncbi:MAG: response regulator [Candidatus Eisenbacteria bacterium]|uniref:histidine kinase n=1 Tax=Eiseniibacteriota bacterium TaxID=2212470 RepID=A0A933SIU6_UNCEI|nr:response regulator [Candidatus Eisenbacteria bacterium]